MWLKMNSLISTICCSISKPHLTLQNIFKRSIYLLTEFNCVDNSELGEVTKRYRKPYLIGFYRKRRTADVGDIIKVAVKGKPCRAMVVATRKPKSDMTPRHDRNNIILLDDSNNPIGTRVKAPVPMILRKHKTKHPKIVNTFQRFV